MSKKPLLPLLSLLVLIPTLTIFLTFHFSTSGAETDPLQEEGFSLLDPLSPGYSGSPVASEAGGSVELELVGRWPYGPALAVTSGEIGGTSYAFLGSGGVVLVLDMTDLTGLTRVAELATPGVVWGLSVSGDMLLVAAGDAGLRVIDISDPASPTEVGFLDTAGSVRRVAVTGVLALVADAGSGLRVIDISDPASPTEVGFLDTPGSTRAVAVTEDLALVADGSSGLRIIDISDPASPAEVGFLDTPELSSGRGRSQGTWT